MSMCVLLCMVSECVYVGGHAYAYAFNTDTCAAREAGTSLSEVRVECLESCSIASFFIISLSSKQKLMDFSSIVWLAILSILLTSVPVLWLL